MFQVFAEVELDTGVDRIGGTRWGPALVPLSGDPTKLIVESAYDGRLHLGDLYGDLRSAPLSFGGRWELYAAPFRLELDSALEELLSPQMQVDLG
jgi:hypothetical protein